MTEHEAPAHDDTRFHAAVAAELATLGGKIDVLTRAVDEIRRRESVISRALDTLRKLTLLQAAAWLVAALSFPMFLAGSVLALTDPGRLLDVGTHLVDAVRGVDTTPCAAVQPAAGAVP